MKANFNRLEKKKIKLFIINLAFRTIKVLITIIT